MKLQDSMTMFFIPFYMENCDMDNLLPSRTIWERSKLKIEKNAIYPHIHDFLVGNVNINSEDSLNPQNCTIYSLKDSWKDVTPEDKCISKIISSFRFEINVGKRDNKKTLTFSFLNEKSNLLSPKLILYPQAQIGLLMLGIELTVENKTVYDLVTLNYHIHKIDKGQSPIIQASIKRDDEISKEKATEINNIYSALNRYATFEKPKRDKDAEGWYLSSFIRFLLSDFEKYQRPVVMFNEERAHLFTYLSVDTEISNDELIEDYVRIIRCQNENYQMMQEELDYGRFYTQTFENIYIGTSVEGTAMMTLAPDFAPDFIKNFKTGSLVPRYLWIYLLVYIQRHTLIELTKELMGVDMKTIDDSKRNLGRIITKLSIMKIKSYFTNISDHTQHNLFYRFCANNLSIEQHFGEIREKVNDLSIILQEKELQQTQEAKENDEQRDRKLGKLLAFMTIAQVFFAFVAFSRANVSFDWTLSLYAGNWKLFIDSLIAVIAAGSIVFSLYIAYIVIKKK